MDVSAPICDLRIIPAGRNRVVLISNTTITVSTKEEVRPDKMPNLKDQSMQVDLTDLAVISAEPEVQNLQQLGEKVVISTEQEMKAPMSNLKDLDPTDLAVISAEPEVQILQQPGETPVYNATRHTALMGPPPTPQDTGYTTSMGPPPTLQKEPIQWARPRATRRAAAASNYPAVSPGESYSVVSPTTAHLKGHADLLYVSLEMFDEKSLMENAEKTLKTDFEKFDRFLGIMLRNINDGVHQTIVRKLICLCLSADSFNKDEIQSWTPPTLDQIKTRIDSTLIPDNLIVKFVYMIQRATNDLITKYSTFSQIEKEETGSQNRDDDDASTDVTLAGHQTRHSPYVLGVGSGKKKIDKNAPSPYRGNDGNSEKGDDDDDDDRYNINRVIERTASGVMRGPIEQPTRGIDDQSDGIPSPLYDNNSDNNDSDDNNDFDSRDELQSATDFLMQSLLESEVEPAVELPALLENEAEPAVPFQNEVEPAVELPVLPENEAEPAVVILTNQSEAQLDIAYDFSMDFDFFNGQNLTQVDSTQIDKELSRTSIITTNIDNINAVTNRHPVAPIDDDLADIEQAPVIHSKKILERIVHYESTLKRMIREQKQNDAAKTDSLIRFFIRTAFVNNFCGIKKEIMNKKQKSTHILQKIMKDENKIKCNDKKLLRVFELLNIALSSGSAHMIPREDYDNTTLSGSVGTRSRSRSPCRLQAKDDLGRSSSPMRSNHISQISDPLIDLDYSCSASEVRIPMEMWRGILSSQQQNLNNMMKTLQIQQNPDTSRIVYLPEFDPEKGDSDAKAWSSTVGLILSEKPLVGGALVMALSRSLKGSASRWLARVSFEGMEWEQFKDNFLSKYVKSETPASTLLSVLDGKPNEGENYSAYAERILSSLSAGWQGLNVEEAAVATVLVHLSQFDCKIRRLVFASNVNSKEALLREMEAITIQESGRRE